MSRARYQLREHFQRLTKRAKEWTGYRACKQVAYPASYLNMTYHKHHRVVLKDVGCSPADRGMQI